jgi:hypothetical protein
LSVAEASLTGWLDPALDYFAKQAGIPTPDYSSQVGGEGIGVGLEILADTFTKGWFNKLVQFGAGAIAGGYAVWGRDVPLRLRRELIAMGMHELLRIVKLTPEDIAELQQSVVQSAMAAKAGDAVAFLASILKSPSEMGLAAPRTPAPTPKAPAAPAPAPAPTPAAAAAAEAEIY